MNSNRYDNFKRLFFATAIADILRAIQGNCLVGAFTLSLCCIDYLMYLENLPQQGVNHEEDFTNFVDRYLRMIDQRYDGQRIYALRCALVHTYGRAKAMEDVIDGFFLIHGNPQYHLQDNDNPIQPNIIRLNLENFVTDVIWSAHQLWKDHNRDNLYQSGTISRAQNLLRIHHSVKHYNLTFISQREEDISTLTPAATGFTGPCTGVGEASDYLDSDNYGANYSDFHRCLATFDREIPDREELLKAITSIIQR